MRRQAKMMMFFGIALLLVVLMLMSRNVLLRLSPKHSAPEPLSGSQAALRYPYTTLSESEQLLYSTLYEGIADFRETIELPQSCTEDEYKRIYLLVANQEPEFFYLDNYYQLADQMDSARMRYRFDEKTAKDMSRELEETADEILKSIPSAQSDAQKLLAIYNQILDRCVYAETANADTAYGCLVEGAAQCAGYAQAFVYLARRADISAMCVTGKTKDDVAHMWNIAQIGGKYYNFDVTWDDADAYGGQRVHACFAVDDTLFTDHIPDTDAFTLPVCSGLSERYYNRSGRVVNELSQFQTKLRGWLSGGENTVEFCCKNLQSYVKLKTMIQTDPKVSEIVHASGKDWEIITDDLRFTFIMLPI